MKYRAKCRFASHTNFERQKKKRAKVVQRRDTIDWFHYCLYFEEMFIPKCGKPIVSRFFKVDTHFSFKYPMTLLSTYCALYWIYFPASSLTKPQQSCMKFDSAIIVLYKSVIGCIIYRVQILWWTLGCRYSIPTLP